MVMDKLKGCSITLDDSDTVKRSLWEAVEIMHKARYVHGDLRPQNLLLVNERVYIVDFDWADTEGIATYPPELSTKCDWHPGVKPGGKICAVHDTYQINSFLPSEDK